MDLAIFLPCRAGSQRVKNKNVKHFSGIAGGLTQIKLEQLINIKAAHTIMVSTNDPQVIEITKQFSDPRIIIDDRPDELASSSTSTDDLIKYVPSVLKAEHILWTHVTSPFFSSEVYDDAIHKYKKGLETDYDSLMSVTPLHKFLWDKKGPLYDTTKEKWPRTQTIEPLFEVNSGVFIAPRNVYLEHENRIGQRPFLYETGEDIAFDIDWDAQFLIAEKIYSSNQEKMGQDTVLCSSSTRDLQA